MADFPERPSWVRIDVSATEGFCWEGLTVRAHYSDEGGAPRFSLTLESYDGRAEVSLTRGDAEVLLDQLREALEESLL